MQIFKILHSKDWQAAQSAGVYRGSADDARDGFIHLSTSDQIAGTLARHFAEATDLMLVALDSDALGTALKWETSRDGADFPHLYSDIDPARVLWSAPIKTKSPGVFALPVQAFATQAQPPRTRMN
jgi:uncharacterized protein (DUF952 family)